MARKPSDTVQVNLRIKEAERRKLEALAKRHQVSLNAEMAERLARTMEQEYLISIDQISASVQRALEPLLSEASELARTNDLMRAADELVTLVLPLVASRHIAGQTGEEIRAAIDKVVTAKRRIQMEAGERLSKIHSTGTKL